MKDSKIRKCQIAGSLKKKTEKIKYKSWVLFSAVQPPKYTIVYQYYISHGNLLLLDNSIKGQSEVWAWQLSI